jgi:hypothetical protein
VAQPRSWATAWAMTAGARNLYLPSFEIPR